MSLLTVLLIFLLFAAWKAPAWVKEIGLLALACGVVWYLCGGWQMNAVLQQSGEIPVAILAGGEKVRLIPLVYGVLIYALSLVIRLAQKPRI